MKITILSQYFPPEVGAPQNRLYELAVRLQAKGAEITILTAMPNYPQMEVHEEYKGKWYARETMDQMRILRAWIFVSKSKSLPLRLLNYFSFVFSSLGIGCLKLRKHDYLICESPPLFLGITAYLLSRFKRSKLIFNVSDLWPESAEKLGLVSNKFFLKSATLLEEFLYRKSKLITGQTQGIVANIQQRFPDKKVYWLPNGVDLSFYKHSEIVSNWRQQNNFNSDDFLLFYAGIIGHAQGLEVILQAAQRLKTHPKIKFILLGNGPEKDKLLQLKAALALDQFYFFDAVKKIEMPEIVAAIDASIIPLKKLDLFKGAIPSKIFENLAMQKPILLGVEGEAKALFIDEGNCGLAFEPENDLELSEVILKFYQDKNLREQLGKNGLNYVESKFTRDQIAVKFWNFINEDFNEKK